jgi:uncharacterized protein
MKWKNGKKQKISHNELINILKAVSRYKNHKIIVGTDSVKFGHDFVFANAICVLNNDNFYDRRYFYNRKKVKDDSYYDLSKRLLRETTESLDIAMDLKKCLVNANIEIHADVNADIRYMSSKYKSMIVGYITGCGFDCKIKPDSFVASGIADCYTRKS